MVRFSIVYPTRDRSLLLDEGLRALTHQTTKDFQVVVSDNPTSDQSSVEHICKDFSELNLLYVRAPRDLSMTENWNHALNFCSGDYILYLTDKMALLPQTLERIDRAFEEAGSKEIISWPSDTYFPDSFDSYLGAGSYREVAPDFRQFNGRDWREYVPIAELESRLNARRSRNQQKPHDYARGKIVFGAYDINLIRRVQHEHGDLFFPRSPDYTSMVLALGMAPSALELRKSGVVSYNTDISNGQLNALSDKRALGWVLRESGGDLKNLQSLLIPGLYSSSHADVASDYVRMLAKLKSPLKPNLRNWVRHCSEDLTRADRAWSSPGVRSEQFETYRNFVRDMGVFDRISVASFEFYLPARRLWGQVLSLAANKSRRLRRVLGKLTPRRLRARLPTQAEKFSVLNSGIKKR